jgi:hypothetical protein
LRGLRRRRMRGREGIEEAGLAGASIPWWREVGGPMPPASLTVPMERV